MICILRNGFADHFLIGFEYIVLAIGRISFPMWGIQRIMSAAPTGLGFVLLLTQHSRAGLHICRAYGALGFASLALLTASALSL